MWKQDFFECWKRGEKTVDLRGGIKKKSKSKASYSHAYVKYTLNSLFSPMFAASFVLCCTGQQQSSRKTIPPPLVTSQWAKFWVCPGSRRLKDWSKQKKEAKRWTSVDAKYYRSEIWANIFRTSCDLWVHPRAPGRYLRDTLTPLGARLLCLLHVLRDTTLDKNKHSRRLPTSRICLRCPADACRLDVKGLITEAWRQRGRELSGEYEIIMNVLSTL